MIEPAMSNFSRKSTISISCPLEMSEWLSREVEELGYRTKNRRPTGLDLYGSLNDCIRLNFSLRTAHRVHYLIGERRGIGDADRLYEWLNRMQWEKYIPSDGYLSVTSRIDHPAIDNQQFANVRAKDAIVDRIREIKGRRPDSGPSLDRTVVFLYWDREIARIYLDTSGESLSRRGYRTQSVQAPMQESLASAILQASVWQPGQHLINPMCGSGTLAIEAALMAMRRPPASLRHDFGFMHIQGYDESHYQAIRAEARQQTVKNPGGQIIATDKDPASVNAARRNAVTAGVDHLITFQTCSFDETPVPDGPGVVLMNPPYGERLDAADHLEPLYRQAGDFLKQKCGGKTGYILTGNFRLAKKIGLRSSRRIPFYNSTIECRLLEFEIYSND